MGCKVGKTNENAKINRSWAINDRLYGRNQHKKGDLSTMKTLIRYTIRSFSESYLPPYVEDSLTKMDLDNSGNRGKNKLLS